jgi:hypothetical protein
LCGCRASTCDADGCTADGPDGQTARYGPRQIGKVCSQRPSERKPLKDLELGGGYVEAPKTSSRATTAVDPKSYAWIAHQRVKLDVDQAGLNRGVGWSVTLRRAAPRENRPASELTFRGCDAPPEQES